MMDLGCDRSPEESTAETASGKEVGMKIDSGSSTFGLRTAMAGEGFEEEGSGERLELLGGLVSFLAESPKSLMCSVVIGVPVQRSQC